ncbi:MAG: hypothetical protein II336_17550 [Loktanella sp.]|nr:hypothetical protein [Loktanella sp.]
MNRTISVSTAVFAAIWAQRQAGEDTEDAILSRVLKCGETDAKPSEPAQKGKGLTDGRSGVHFAEGFEVFRNYKRKQYKGVVEGSQWVRLDTGERFPTLNQLNQSIVDGNENVWNGNWKFLGSDGTQRSISELR